MTKTTKEKSILFSTSMVQAILLDRKSQTRRVCKPALEHNLSYVVYDEDGDFYGDKERYFQFKAPYKVGDHLWVREIHHLNHANGKVTYRADYHLDPFDKNESCDDEFTGDEKWLSPIFMPKKLARIWLEITNVRIEKLQDISRKDATAEGLDRQDGVLGTVYREYDKTGIWDSNSINSFRSLWNSIYSKDETKSWEANPYVWVYEFKRI